MDLRLKGSFKSLQSRDFEDWAKISFVEGRGTTTEMTDYVTKTKLPIPEIIFID